MMVIELSVSSTSIALAVIINYKLLCHRELLMGHVYVLTCEFSFGGQNVITTHNTIIIIIILILITHGQLRGQFQ